MLSDLFFIPQFASSHDKTQSNFTTDLFPMDPTTNVFHTKLIRATRRRAEMFSRFHLIWPFPRRMFRKIQNFTFALRYVSLLGQIYIFRTISQPRALSSDIPATSLSIRRFWGKRANQPPEGIYLFNIVQGALPLRKNSKGRRLDRRPGLYSRYIWWGTPRNHSESNRKVKIGLVKITWQSTRA